MLELQANTAYTLKIGPFIDETDGKTAETGLTITQAEVRLSKNGGDIAQKNESTSCTHDELGVYGCPIDTTDTNTEGVLQLWVHESGALPVFHEYMVLAQAAYISKYTAKDTGYMDVNVKAISEDTTSADDLELFTENAKGTDHKVLISTDAQDLNASLHVNAKAISASTAAADNVEANIGNLDASIQAVDDSVGTILIAVQSGTYGLSALKTEIDANETKIDAIKAMTDNLPSAVKKNTALSDFPFTMVLSSDHASAATGKTLTEERSIDGGAFAACANSATEISAGAYKIDLATTDLNGNVILLKFSETDCDTRFILIITKS